jgi:hypothetical protein
MVFVLGRDMPKWRVDITGDVARFVVGNTPRELIRAERRGQRLRWRELPELERPCHRAVRRRAAMTFAIALAMQGWPLQRERESDIQDGLSAAAFGVQFGEAWFRMNRWVVRTPQIPGLPPIALFML